MRNRKISVGLIVVLAIFTVSLMATSTRAAAQPEVVLHSFPVGSTDGCEPLGQCGFQRRHTTLRHDAGRGHRHTVPKRDGVRASGKARRVDRDAYSSLRPEHHGRESVSSGLLLHAGKLYGTTIGGSSGYGAVFELTYTAGIGWAKTFEYAFPGFTNDGQGPGTLIYANGNIYGTTGAGGSNLNCGTSGELVGCGTVFQLTPLPGGGWSESVVYNFGNGSDGQIPVGLLFHGGNFYGVAQKGGQYSEGMVFELNPKTWIETDLHDFPMPTTGGVDGAVPTVGLTVDSAGNLYGTTSQGGTYNYGIVFELTYDKTTKIWTETPLHDFDYSADGAYPYGLILDKSGNLYGTTSEGGSNNTGAAFELAAGTWAPTILYNFCSLSNCVDGSYPSSGLTFDTNYNLYGTTQEGGANGWGTAFQIILNDFALSPAPGTLTVSQGNSVESIISVADLGGFTGNVTLSASGLPKGVTASFSPRTTSGTSTLTLTASATAKIGTKGVTVAGTSGNLYHTATINLTVN